MQYERELIQGMLPKEDHFDSSSSIDGNMNSLTLQKLSKQGPGQYHYDSDDMDTVEGGKKVDEVKRQILMDEKMFEAAREGDLTSVSAWFSVKQKVIGQSTRGGWVLIVQKICEAARMALNEKMCKASRMASYA